MALTNCGIIDCKESKFLAANLLELSKACSLSLRHFSMADSTSLATASAAPSRVVLIESLRLSKKFSSPDSYKFINVSLDKFLKTLK